MSGVSSQMDGFEGVMKFRGPGPGRLFLQEKLDIGGALKAQSGKFRLASVGLISEACVKIDQQIKRGVISIAKYTARDEREGGSRRSAKTQ